MSNAVLGSRGNEARWRGWAVGLLAVGFVLTFWGTVGKDRLQVNDFGAYYRAAHYVAGGQTPYQVDQYGPMGTYCYAPAFAYLLIPLAQLDYVWSCRCWLLMNWAATVVGFYLALKLVRGGGPVARPWGVLCLGVLPVLCHLQDNMCRGQASMFVMLGCLGWALCRRHGRPFLGGVLLAAACACKLYPFVLAPYLLLRRDWRGLAGLGVGLFALCLVPVPWVGWDGTLATHRDWLRHTTITQIPLQTYRPGNQSLLGVIARLPVVSNGGECYSPELLAALSRWYPLLAAALAAGLYGVVAAGVFRAPTNQSPEHARSRENVHLALLFIFMTLVGPRSWRCNYVALVFPCMLLAAHVWQRGSGYRFTLAAMWFLLVAPLWFAVTPAPGGWYPDEWLRQGSHFWGGVGVAAACFALPRPPITSRRPGR